VQDFYGEMPVIFEEDAVMCRHPVYFKGIQGEEAARGLQERVGGVICR